MYEVRFLDGVEAVYRRLPPEIKAVAKEALKALKANPLSGKPLEGDLKELYSLRFMRYRIVYAIDMAEKVVWVYGIGHRSKIYEYMTEMIGLLRGKQAETRSTHCREQTDD